MAETAIIEKLKQYLADLPVRGIHARRAVLFGSRAKGNAEAWSDIDLIVLAPEFDGNYSYDLVRELWHACPWGGPPIEPIPCGEQEWETDDGRVILEIARREGIEICL